MKTGIAKIRPDTVNYFIFIVISGHLFLKILNVGGGDTTHSELFIPYKLNLKKPK